MLQILAKIPIEDACVAIEDLSCQQEVLEMLSKEKASDIASGISVTRISNFLMHGKHLLSVATLRKIEDQKIGQALHLVSDEKLAELLAEMKPAEVARVLSYLKESRLKDVALMLDKNLLAKTLQCGIIPQTVALQLLNMLPEESSRAITDKLKTEEILQKHTSPENWSNWENTIQRASRKSIFLQSPIYT